jgi:hypothetical protein
MRNELVRAEFLQYYKVELFKYGSAASFSQKKDEGVYAAECLWLSAFNLGMDSL